MADLSAMCSFVMMRINALLDDELDEATANQVREHISNCEHCLEEVEIWIAIRNAIKSAYAPNPAPPSLIERVGAQIRNSAA